MVVGVVVAVGGGVIGDCGGLLLLWRWWCISYVNGSCLPPGRQ